MDLAKTIIHTIDERGEPIARVPLSHGRHGWATIDEADLELLEGLGLSLNWGLLNGKYVIAPTWHATGRLLTVARVLLDAGKGESVKYLNGDGADLRRHNLALNESGWGSRRDRDYITPWKAKRQRKGLDHAYV